MLRQNGLVGSILVLSIVIGACGGGSRTDDAGDLSNYFPQRVEATALEKSPEIRTFAGDSLWQYIDGGAEIYHTYGFVKVSTADYRNSGAELVLDLYEFKTPEGAYGLYSAFRPDTPELLNLGVEGFFTGASLEFVRGNFMVRLTGYNESEATGAALKSLATQMASVLPGTTESPAMFKLFPTTGMVPYTDKIIGASFLGQPFLNMVYTRDYQYENEKLTLFLVSDPTGETFAQWFERSSDAEKSAAAAAGLPFDENYRLSVANNYYGTILVGLKNGKLAGVLNYFDRHRQFFADWLQTIPK